MNSLNFLLAAAWQGQGSATIGLAFSQTILITKKGDCILDKPKVFSYL